MCAHGTTRPAQRVPSLTGVCAERPVGRRGRLLPREASSFRSAQSPVARSRERRNSSRTIAVRAGWVVLMACELELRVRDKPIEGRDPGVPIGPLRIPFDAGDEMRVEVVPRPTGALHDEHRQSQVHAPATARRTPALRCRGGSDGSARPSSRIGNASQPRDANHRVPGDEAGEPSSSSSSCPPGAAAARGSGPRLRSPRCVSRPRRDRVPHLRQQHAWFSHHARP